MADPLYEKDPWQAGTFEGSRIAQTQDMAKRPLIERLRWACEMSEVIRIRDLTAGRIPPALNPKRYD
jgi:hypothetical protein